MSTVQWQARTGVPQELRRGHEVHALQRLHMLQAQWESVSYAVQLQIPLHAYSTCRLHGCHKPRAV